jgi:hypothetical protein
MMIQEANKTMKIFEVLSKWREESVDPYIATRRIDLHANLSEAAKKRKIK